MMVNFAQAQTFSILWLSSSYIRKVSQAILPTLCRRGEACEWFSKCHSQVSTLDICHTAVHWIGSKCSSGLEFDIPRTLCLSSRLFNVIKVLPIFCAIWQKLIELPSPQGKDWQTWINYVTFYHCNGFFGQIKGKTLKRKILLQTSVKRWKCNRCNIKIIDQHCFDFYLASFARPCQWANHLPSGQ